MSVRAAATVSRWTGSWKRPCSTSWMPNGALALFILDSNRSKYYPEYAGTDDKLSTILNHLTEMFDQDRADFIASFDKYDLFIIDALGVKRSTKYAMEQMFFVIDSCYRIRRPMIITINLKLAGLKTPPDLAHACIGDRILERCTPILFAVKDFWKENAEATKQAAKHIVNRKYE